MSDDRIKEMRAAYATLQAARAAQDKLYAQSFTGDRQWFHDMSAARRALAEAYGIFLPFLSDVPPTVLNDVVTMAITDATIGLRQAADRTDEQVARWGDDQ